MAVGTAYTSTNMENAQVWYGTITIATSNHIQVASGGSVQNYYGYGFTYSPYAVIGGTVTSTNYYEFGTKIYEIGGTSLSAVTVASYVQSGNMQGVLAYALSGADTLNGSPQHDVIKGYTGSDILHGNAGNDVLYGNSGDDVLIGGAGNDLIDGGAGTDTAAWTGIAANYQVSRPGSDWIVSARTGSDGTDVAVNVERLQFADRTVPVESREHGSYADLPEALWHFFIVAFDAAPGVTYMDQLADASRFGMSVRQIVDVFTSKSQFTEVYPATLSNAQLGVALAENIIKDSASPQARAEAAADIQGALDIGWTMGQMIHTVFGNLGAKAYDDPVWGGTALQFHNQIQVSKYYTEVLNQSTTDLPTLRAVLDPVTQFSDVSSEQALDTLVGVALFEG
ncbi:calcium-binding protein [Quisquiliibacterium transsilvanicum]|uniref:Calcium-binding protein n=1 Tax=Quisquiliibacterium transsilvanicum TaxID=1549638 RepID=A0A7W8M8R7_9BURK|nr:calcium-binding protein [Quisquiliibacterium transsilvanicum]MBB5271932.1 hypothetical protein [Quisquiliibacterium transsilvanicum]